MLSHRGSLQQSVRDLRIFCHVPSARWIFRSDRRSARSRRLRSIAARRTRTRSCMRARVSVARREEVRAAVLLPTAIEADVTAGAVL